MTFQANFSASQNGLCSLKGAVNWDLMDFAKGSSFNICCPFSLLNDIGLGRSSWLKSTPHFYTFFSLCDWDAGVVSCYDQRPAEERSRLCHRQPWGTGSGVPVQDMYPISPESAEKLLRLKKIIAEVLGKHSEREPGFFWFPLKAAALSFREAAWVLLVRKHLPPAKILVSSVCVGRACRGRLPRADMRDDIGD